LHDFDQCLQGFLQNLLRRVFFLVDNSGGVSDTRHKMKPDTAKRRPANPADNRLTVRFSPEEIRRIVADSRKRRVFPSETVRQIIRLYYAQKTRRVK